MSSPLHAEELVDHPQYDHEFSVNINKKMTVPDKIKLVEGNFSDMLEDPAIIAIKKMSDNANMMRVPDCIRVAGGESHVTTREPPPEIKLEDSLFGKPHDELIQLTTPPRTLRYEDTSPVFDESIKQLDKVLHSDTKVLATRPNDTRMNESLIEYEDPDLTTSQNYLQLRRRLLQLSHRIDSLEIESRRRTKRDYFLYTLGLLYMMFRGFNWLTTTRNRFTF